MAAFEVMFYEKENGYCPVEEFITSLDLKMRAKNGWFAGIIRRKGQSAQRAI